MWIHQPAVVLVVLCSCQEYIAFNVQTVSLATVIDCYCLRTPSPPRQMDSPVEELERQTCTSTPTTAKLCLRLRQYHMSPCPF